MNCGGCETIILNYRGSCQPAEEEEEEEASEIDEKQNLNYGGSAAINLNYRGFRWENRKRLQFEFWTAELL